MDNKYEMFLTNSAVINIKTEQEFLNFTALMKKLGLKKVEHLEKICNVFGFEKGFYYNAGVKWYDVNDLCFEYQIGKGFTFSGIKEYKKSEYEICTLDDICSATDHYIIVDNKIIEKPDNPKMVAYVRFNTIEKYNSFYKLDEIKRTLSSGKYEPMQGFYDLRDYNIPEEEFNNLWELQLKLKNYEENKNYFKTFMPDLWEQMKKLSSEYQSALFQYPLKKTQKDRQQDIVEEIEK